MSKVSLHKILCVCVCVCVFCKQSFSLYDFVLCMLIDSKGEVSLYKTLYCVAILTFVNNVSP